MLLNPSFLIVADVADDTPDPGRGDAQYQHQQAGGKPGHSGYNAAGIHCGSKSHHTTSLASNY